MHDPFQHNQSQRGSFGVGGEPSAGYPQQPNQGGHQQSSQQPLQFPQFQDFGTIVDSPFAQVATSLGGNWIAHGSANAASQYRKNLSVLKYYFNVNNSYVVNKIKLILFPLAHKYWKRRIHRQGEAEVYLPPREDINAPDLYIPLMSFVTYVLTIGYLMGQSNQFTPAVLGNTATAGLLMLALEVGIIKFGFYLLSAYTCPVMDLVSFCSYKYVGVEVTILAGLLLGKYGFYGFLLVSSLFMAIFMVKTLKLVFPGVEAGQEYNRHKNRNNYFLLGLGILQFFVCWYLSFGTLQSPAAVSVTE
eukprot:TRINITY_DN1393_c0_g1_i1.p1 TRINITY_DN1393_c0_g1~~TRINITY_DN1393_c0_g1_i1.p1  ORF type:complete len:303 (+),score=68.59 TRINITY_DN1393_c0_g1_i1:65-973(+)